MDLSIPLVIAFLPTVAAAPPGTSENKRDGPSSSRMSEPLERSEKGPHVIPVPAKSLPSLCSAKLSDAHIVASFAPGIVRTAPIPVRV